MVDLFAINWMVFLVVGVVFVMMVVLRLLLLDIAIFTLKVIHNLYIESRNCKWYQMLYEIQSTLESYVACRLAVKL